MGLSFEILLTDSRFLWATQAGMLCNINQCTEFNGYFCEYPFRNVFHKNVILLIEIQIEKLRVMENICIFCSRSLWREISDMNDNLILV